MADEVIRIQADIEGIKKSLDELEKKFEETEQSAKGVGDSTDKSQKKGSQSIKNTTSDLSKQEKQVDKLGNSVMRLGKRLVAAYSVSQVLRNAFRVVTNFENANANLNATLGKTAEETEKLRKQQLQLGASTKFTAAQVADAQLELGKLGQTLPQITKTTPSVLNLAAAIGVDLATAAIVVNETLNQFQLDASQASDVVDVMGKAFTTSALDMTKFSEAMKFVGPTAAAAGVSLREVTAMMAVLANAGISGSNAGTALRRILSDMAKTGKPAAEALRELGERGISLSDAYDEVGRSAQSALLVLTKNTQAIQDNAKAYDNVKGTIQEMADKQLQTLTAKITILQSAWEGMILSIENGDGAISKAMKGIVESFTFALNRLQTINDVTERTGKSMVEFTFGLNRALLEFAEASKPYVDEIRELFGTDLAEAARKIRLLESSAANELNPDKAKFLRSVIKELRIELDEIKNQDVGPLIAGTKEAEKEVRGIVERLKEQIKATDELIEKATSQREINSLLERRRDLEIRLNWTLNERAMMLELLSEKETKLLDDTASRQVAQMKLADEQFNKETDFIQQLIDEQIRANGDKMLSDKEAAQFRLELEKQYFSDTLQAASNFFEAFGLLANEDAEAFKVFATFKAIIDAWNAINTVLAQTGNPILAASIGALAFANVVRIQQQEVPKYFEGTDYLKLNGNPKGRDTIPVMAHEGEAIIPTKRNQEAPGLAKAWINGNLDTYIRREHLDPILRQKQQEIEELKQAAFAQSFGSLPVFQDNRIVSELRRNRHVSEDMVYLLSKMTNKRNPYRA